MADLILSGAFIITIDASRRVIPNGSVAITGGKITAIGPKDEIESQYSAPEIIDAGGKVMLPGLIDVHAHAGHGLIKTMGMEQGDVWEEICGKVYTNASPPEFWYAEVEYPTVEAALRWQPEACGLAAYLNDEVTNQPGQSMGAYWAQTRG